MMSKEITVKDAYQAIEKVEHPEIAATLVELGMIQDLVVEKNTVRVAMALPTLGIPDIIRKMLEDSIRKPLEEMGFTVAIEIFEMSDQAKNKFFTLARSNWKGTV